MNDGRMNDMFKQMDELFLKVDSLTLEIKTLKNGSMSSFWTLFLRIFLFSRDHFHRSIIF